jgi:hypothetical protein
MEPSQSGKEITLRELFPNLPEGRLKEAEENLCRYVEVALQIHRRGELVPADLDRSQASSRMKERSKSNSFEHG